MTYFFITLILIVLFVFQLNTIIKNISKSNFKNLNINLKESFIELEHIKIPFREIKYIDVTELENQPNAAERYFTKYAHNYFFAEINFYLNNGTIQKYQTNSKGQLYKILKMLSAYVNIQTNINDYKVKFLDGPSLFGLILVIIYIIFHYLK